MIEARAADKEKDKTPPVVIHVIPGVAAEGAPAYRLDDEAFEHTEQGLQALSRRVAESIARNPGAEVHVRAERLEDYARVRPALEAARKGGASTVGLVTQSPTSPAQDSAP